VTPDAFRRFALVVACTLYMLGLGLVWRWLGPWVAAGVYALGIVHAFLFTVEPEPSKPKVVRTDVSKRGSRIGGRLISRVDGAREATEGLSRRDITRRARTAGEEDE
jgi:hypothetical protein